MPTQPTLQESKANQRQVAGGHYQRNGRQHWDVVIHFRLDYFQGQITKYIFRWRDKNGLTDLEKAAHYIEKYLEEQPLVHNNNNNNNNNNIATWEELTEVHVEFGLDTSQAAIFDYVVNWGGKTGYLESAGQILGSYIDEQRKNYRHLPSSV